MVPGKDAVPPTFLQLAAHPVRWRLMTELAASDLRVRELVDRLGQPQNLVSYHLRLLRDSELVTSRRSSGDGRDTYYHLDLDRCASEMGAAAAALHPSVRPSDPPPERHRGTTTGVMFVCTGNSARSPIAEALLRHRTGGQVAVASAGVSPKNRVHPQAVRVLREEFGIDVRGQSPRSIDDVAASGVRFGRVVTLCDKARERIPVRDDWRRTHWSIPDPAGEESAGHAHFIATARDIDTRVRHLIPTL